MTDIKELLNKQHQKNKQSKQTAPHKPVEQKKTDTPQVKNTSQKPAEQQTLAEILNGQCFCDCIHLIQMVEFLLSESTSQTATHCITVQHTALLCNTLQHTATC